MTISTNRWGGDTSAPGGWETSAASTSDSSSAPATTTTSVPAPAPDRSRARWSRSPNVVDRPTLRGVMVLPADGAAVVLTGTAAQVWQALSRPAAGDELVQRLAPAAGGNSAADEIGAALDRLRVLGAVRETR
jgi:hypothetical protein